MKRTDALAWIRIAGYHNDQKSFVRLYVENRVSRKSADEAWAKGVKAKESGMGCACHQCKNQPPQEKKEVTDPAKFLYDVTAREATQFQGNSRITPNDHLQHGAPTIAASYNANNSDGHDVEVFVTAMPARFYRVGVAPRGDKPGYTITTGSSCSDLVRKIAEAIADGMLGFEPKDPAGK